MDFMSTVKGSLLEGFYPKGWDMAKIDRCCANRPADAGKRQPFWHKDFKPLPCADVAEFDVKMGHEIANEIRKAKEAGRKIVFILPVGPMGMYKWAVYFLKEWNVDCKHVWCFNMDEWADAKGNTLVGDASFQYAMEQALYNPLGKLTVPKDHRNFATKDNLPTYPKKKQPYRIGVKLHPLTIEQNAITSFKSRTTLVPCRANTMGPGIMFQADWAIGGADGALSRGMQWQGMSFWMTLRYGPSRWVTSSWIPTLPGRLFFLSELAGPLVAEAN